MAVKPGADLTSSMTSVTEEDGSLSESDTTETCNSNFSSLLYSSDYNTDDKLTPCLNSISISKGSCKKMKKSTFFKEENNKCENKLACNRGNDTQDLTTHNFVHPSTTKFSSHIKGVPKHKKRAKRKNTKQSLGKRHRNRTMVETDSSSRGHPDIETNWNSFAFDHPDHNLYTDFSNNKCFYHVPGAELLTGDEEDIESIADSERSFFPDMTSPVWYTAQVFDSYWSHYNFVMDWYRHHVKFVHSQFAQQFSPAFPTNPPQPSKKKSISKEKKKKRARKRRAARAKRQQRPDCDENVVSDEDDLQEGDAFEMEITEDMMDFFSQSFKHRLERDKGKEEDEKENKLESRIDIEHAMSGQQGPRSTTPNERPGVRRTAEMKLLYGKGAAMIHGMETALQMTFDKVMDRQQPKLWPNMPLKMSFA